MAHIVSEKWHRHKKISKFEILPLILLQLKNKSTIKEGKKFINVSMRVLAVIEWNRFLNS